MKFILPLLFFAFAACNNSGNNDAAQTEIMASRDTKAEYMKSAKIQAESPPSVTDRKLIKDGDIYMEVKTLENTRNELNKLIAQYKAYIANESQAEYDNRKEISFAIKIPVSQYEAFCESVTGLAVNVERKNLNALDVTEEFVDTQARITAKKALEKRYLELLAKAKNVNEMLAIERELANVREDIEAKEGRIKLLENQSSLSTLNLTVYQVSNKTPGFMRSAGQALVGGWFAMIKFALFLLRMWPFLLVLSLILYFGKKRFRPQKK